MKNSFSDEGDLRKYFAAIPNIVFRLGLNPYELALYSHFKQAAGDNGGVCWKSRATIAKETRMSTGMVTKARAALEKPQPLLGGFPLIRAKEIPHKDGGKPTCHVMITDIWPINMARFAPSHHDVVNGSTSLSVTTTSQGDQSTSPRGHKEELLKKNSEEVPDALAKYKSDPLYARLDVECEFQLADRWADAHGKKVTPRFFVNWLNRSLKDLPLSSNGNGRDAAFHARQAELAKRMGREYRPDAS